MATDFKHEYLRSRASKRMSLSSSGDIWQIIEILVLTSWILHQRIFKQKYVDTYVDDFSHFTIYCSFVLLICVWQDNVSFCSNTYYCSTLVRHVPRSPYRKDLKFQNVCQGNLLYDLTYLIVLIQFTYNVPELPRNVFPSMFSNKVNKRCSHIYALIKPSNGFHLFLHSN